MASGQNPGEGFGGVAVAAGYGVGVDVEGGRRAGVAEPLGHRGDRDAAASIWVAIK